MKTQWFQGLKTEEKENFKKSVLQSQKVLDKLKEICYNMYMDKRNVTFSDYDSPSWSAKQAHTNGYCEALQNVLALLELNNKEA